MKFIKSLFVVLMLLSLFGCSSKENPQEEEQKTANTKFNVEISNIDGYEYPSALGKLSNDGSINTYIDLLKSLEENNDTSDPASLVDSACKELYGKYDEMGSIILLKDDQPYSLLYIKNNDLYYPLDVFAQYRDKAPWMDGYDSEALVFDKLKDTIDALKKGNATIKKAEARTIYAKAKTGEVFNIDYEEYGMAMYMYDEFKVPFALGLPQLTREEAAAVDENNEADVINTYPDLLMYIKDRTDYIEPNSPNLLHGYILLGDYPTVGILRVNRSGEGASCVLVLGNDDKYYVCDLFQKATAAKNMKIFPDVCGMKEFASIKEITDTFSKEFPWGGAVLSAEIEDIDVPDRIKAPNGMYLRVDKRLGVDVIDYFNVQIPLGLGLPELTEQEVKKLAEKKDPIEIKDSINTFADAVCLLTYLDYRMADNLPGNNPFGAINVGNIKYDGRDGFVYSTSGAELLKINQGQCVALSTLFSFLLKDDYEELCYIHLTAIDDSHVMIYIKNNGSYYLMNPVNYTKNRRPDGTYDDYFPHDWLPDFKDDDVVCSESLEDMMVSLSQGYLASSKITKVITIDYDGICVRGNKNGDNPGVPGNYNVYPTGAKAVAWTPDSPIDYRDPKHPTSQLEIIGIADYINGQ